MDFDYRRDSKILFLIVTVVIVILIIFAAETIDATIIEIFQAVCITLVGTYGGIRGRGQDKPLLERATPAAPAAPTAPTAPADNKDEYNTFGFRPGLMRLLFGVCFLILAAFVGLILNSPSRSMFLLGLGFEALGLSVPALARLVRQEEQ